MNVFTSKEDNLLELAGKESLLQLNYDKFKKFGLNPEYFLKIEANLLLYKEK